jgi:hypothetical protein
VRVVGGESEVQGVAAVRIGYPSGPSAESVNQPGNPR